MHKVIYHWDHCFFLKVFWSIFYLRKEITLTRMQIHTQICKIILNFAWPWGCAAWRPFKKTYSEHQEIFWNSKSFFCLLNHLPSEQDRENWVRKTKFHLWRKPNSRYYFKNSTLNLRNANHWSSPKLVTLKYILSGPTEKAQNENHKIFI